MSHWSAQKERGSIVGMQILIFVYRLAGRRFFKILLLPVMLYFFLVNKRARSASHAFLSRAFAAQTHGHSLTRKPTWRTSFQHFMQFGDAMLDKLAAWMGNIPATQIDFPEQTLLVDLIRSGRGALLIGSHLGNIELARAVAHGAGHLPVQTKVQAVVFTEHAQKFQRMLRAINPEAEDNIIAVNDIGPDTAVKLQQCIAEGQLLVIVGDRTPVHSHNRTVDAEFLGASAPFSQGPFILASLLECPVYLFFCLREGDRFHIYLEHFADRVRLPRTSRTQTTRAYAQAYATRLGYYATLAPLQWFNFFDFWAPQAASTATEKTS